MLRFRYKTAADAGTELIKIRRIENFLFPDDNMSEAQIKDSNSTDFWPYFDFTAVPAALAKNDVQHPVPTERRKSIQDAIPTRIPPARKAKKRNEKFPLHKLPRDILYCVMEMVLERQEIPIDSPKSQLHTLGSHIKGILGPFGRRRVHEYFFDTNVLLVCRDWYRIGRAVLVAHIRRQRLKPLFMPGADTSWLYTTNFSHRQLPAPQNGRKIRRAPPPLAHLTLCLEPWGWQEVFMGILQEQEVPAHPLRAGGPNCAEISCLVTDLSLQSMVIRMAEIPPAMIWQMENFGIDRREASVDSVWFQHQLKCIRNSLSNIDIRRASLLDATPGFNHVNHRTVSIVYPNDPQLSLLATRNIYNRLTKIEDKIRQQMAEKEAAAKAAALAAAQKRAAIVAEEVAKAEEEDERAREWAEVLVWEAEFLAMEAAEEAAEAAAAAEADEADEADEAAEQEANKAGDAGEAGEAGEAAEAPSMVLEGEGAASSSSDESKRSSSVAFETASEGEEGEEYFAKRLRTDGAEDEDAYVENEEEGEEE